MRLTGAGRDQTEFSVGTGFHNGIECKQMQCLLSSVEHSGNSEWPHRFAVRCGNVDTSKGLRLIATALEFVNCLCFLLWCIPNFSVYTGGFLAIIFRHSSNGENLAAVRVGQQALQGSHLAPSAFLCCLRDTHLESANVAVIGLPINGVPLRRFA